MYTVYISSSSNNSNKFTAYKIIRITDKRLSRKKPVMVPAIADI